MKVVIRAERAGDEQDIHELTLAAFEDLPYASHTEHQIVDALRDAGHLTVLLVADDDGEIIGHVAATSLVLPGVPAEYFQMVAFANEVPVGVVRYSPAFLAGSS